MGNFEKSVEFVLKHEGGYVNNSADPGGETKYGISRRAFPDEDIKNLTVDRAKEIYQKHFWEPLGCEELSTQLALVHFDTAVNCGKSRAAEFMGNSKGDYEVYLLYRIEHYTRIAATNKNLRQFILGWLNRVMDLFKEIRGIK
jgi:lysozyme family protein